MTVRHVLAVAGSAILVFGIMTLAIVFGLRVNPLRGSIITGAVIVDDTDVRKQMPIADVHVRAAVGGHFIETTTTQAGYFHLEIPAIVRLTRPIEITFERQGFLPETIVRTGSQDLLIARLRPEITRSGRAPHHTLSNIRIRYTVRSESLIDIGAVAETFQVKNVGNVPCRGAAICSPGGDWRAATGGITVDAHAGNRLRNTRVSCVAGPCPFARIEREELHGDGRLFTVRALDWSDTTTFLVEADVVHLQQTDLVRESFPVIFGRGMSFTLPGSAEGPSIEAELDGKAIVFPLGPELILPWATCSFNRQPDGSALYSCELRDNYGYQ